MNTKQFTFLDESNIPQLIRLLDARYVVGLASDSSYGLIKLYDTVGNNIDGTMTQDAISKRLATVYTYKGSVESLNDLPNKNSVGDVYNITLEDSANGIKAGDNIAWNGSKWDNLSGFVNLSEYLKKNGQYIKGVTFNSETNTLVFLLPNDTINSIVIPRGLSSTNTIFDDTEETVLIDLDTLFDVGIYNITDLTKVTNIPINELGTLIIFSSESFMHQNYFTVSGKLVSRIYNESTMLWSDWNTVNSDLKNLSSLSHVVNNPNFNELEDKAYCSVEVVTNATNYPVQIPGMLQNIKGTNYHFQVYTTIDNQVYNRCKINNVWSAWTEVIPTVTELASGDLDSLITQKTYHIPEINVVINKPFITAYGEVIVTKSDIFIFQKFFTNENKVYIREKEGEKSWTSWINIIDSNEILKYALLNSPAFSGNPTVSQEIDTLDSSKSIANTEYVSNKLNSYALIDSPALTGVPTSVTPERGDSTNKIATTRYVMNAIAGLINSAPESLDTLFELATALNNDPDFANTIITELGTKLNLTGGTITGNLIVEGTLDATRANKDGSGNNIESTYMAKTGGTYTGNVTHQANLILDAKSGYGTGVASAWYNGTTKTIDFDGEVENIDLNAASATKATQDENGLNIVNNYLKKTDASTTYLGISDKAVSSSTADKLSSKYSIDGINFDGSTFVSHFVECETAGNVANKTVSIDNFTLVKGSRITVNFKYTNTATNPTLNVSSTGAKSIYYRGYPVVSDAIQEESVYDLIFDGSKWLMVGSVIWTD